MSEEKISRKSIEELEGDYWVAPVNFPSSLVEKVFLLRKKPLEDFNSSDLRILISQNIGLKYIVPKAIDILRKDILHEAFYYPGDLLSAMFNIDNDYWIKNSDKLSLFISILNESKHKIEQDEESDEVYEELINSISKFLSKY